MTTIKTILMKLDNNKKGDTLAVIAARIDWKHAFPRAAMPLGVLGQSDISEVAWSDIQSEDTEWLWPTGEYSRSTRIPEPE